eukprot:TRINITY_DN11304_c0_g1_i7.p1 TRINITY_DN11304_c0_g1~~TRINITY_DN11304_c0_g1_i7.p1  ORF type:complete len:345 (+),score=127.93 TRINITY_DN11304_c0_g1_i7:980-2014(+)
MDENLRKRLDSVCQDELRRQAGSMDEMEFDGKRISVSSEKVRVAILQAGEAKLELSKQSDYDGLMEAFDKVFIAYNDTTQLISDELKSVEQKKAGVRSESQIADLRQLDHYVNALKLEQTIARNEAMVADLEIRLAEHSPTVKPDDLMRIYNILVQNTEDMGGMYEDQEGDSAKAVLGKCGVFKAFRCAHLAGKFSCECKYPEAVALYDRADGLARMALAGLRDCAEPQTKFSTALSDLQLKIRGAKCAVQAEAFLQDQTAEAAPASADKDVCLLDRLDEWAPVQPGAPANLIQIPPTLQPIPCKPVVYDLAFNHIMMPDLSHKAAKQQGMFGKAKGLLGKLWG